MHANLTPTAEQQAILERLRVPERIKVALRHPSLALAVEDAEVVRDALTTELATVGFDPEYELTAEGRLIEDLIDALFIP
ncbi:hypothetical protein [Brevundimonas sp.]|uniref:hypothetical protein n=1 Tax=Brevundimonas sp. TaxID=1871086 RepID=UPI003D0CCC30